MIGRTPPWIPIFVWTMSLFWAIPILGIVVMSLRPSSEVVFGWWSLSPFSLTLDAWFKVWGKYNLGSGFWVSLQLATLATIGTMLLTPAAAYAFQFLKFPFRRTILVIIINAFVLPQQVIIIPLFQLWRTTGLMDTLLAVLIPYVGLSFAWSIFLVKNFLDDFPKELIEAARIDGCGPLSTFFRVVLPNSLSPIFALGILQFLFCWNGFLIPLLYLRTQAPLPVVFATISGTHELNFNLQAVAAIVTTTVPLLIFIIFQRQFAVGATTRSGNKE
jgi:ABC-type glycerol-3-phosphate transport system permease component